MVIKQIMTAQHHSDEEEEKRAPSNQHRAYNARVGGLENLRECGKDVFAA
jgi:hypothetical protein